MEIPTGSEAWSAGFIISQSIIPVGGHTLGSNELPDVPDLDED